MPVRIAFPSSNQVTSNSKKDIFKPGASTVVGLLLTAFEEGASDEGFSDEGQSTGNFIEKDIWGHELNSDNPTNDLNGENRNTSGKKENEQEKGHKKNKFRKKGGIKEFVDSLFGNTKETDNEA